MRRIFALSAAVAALLCAPLSARAADECLDCHELAAISPGGTVVHPPFAEKDCGSCHADHGDEERLMLTEEGNALCAQCHESADDAFRAAHRKIAATGKAPCTGCHDPHGSPNKGLLRPRLHGPVAMGNCEQCHRSDGKLLIPVNRDFCYLCHARTGFTKSVVHDPVKKGRCLECHDPHGSGSARLLKGAYSLDREVSKGGREYAFCFSCHARPQLFEGTANPFNDGSRNLHALHVLVRGRRSEKAAEEKGLTCRVCHEPHSGTTAALTRTELDCGASLCMKMEFRRSAAGGECMASCHGEKMRYTRAAR